MESISTSLVTQQLLTVAANRAQLTGLAIGQHLTGTVLSVSQRGTVALQINQHTLNARTTLPLIAGQTLTLVVDKIGPELRLRMLDQQLQASGLAQAIRKQLPRQGSMLELLSSFHRISNQADRLQLPRTIAQLIRNITQGFTVVNESLSGQGVKQAVVNSGHFLEQRILKMLADYRGGVLARDFKAGLLRLRAALSEIVQQNIPEPRPRDPGNRQSAQAAATNPSPNPGAAAPQEAVLQNFLAKLLQQVEGALARIQLLQLTTLSEQEGAKSAWTLELPVRDGDELRLVRFRIGKRQRQGKGSSEDAFAVTFSLDLEPLGTIQSRISCSQGSVSAILRTERDTTAALVNARLDELQRRLSRTGLTPETVACVHGLADDDAETIQTPLLDLRA